MPLGLLAFTNSGNCYLAI